jgi:hypothetical protein
MSEVIEKPIKSRATKAEVFTIAPPDIRTIEVTIIGLTPLMICRFSQKAMEAIKAKQAKGGKAKKGEVREARDFDADFRGAHHVSTEGWNGVHASSIRNGMIDACRLVNFKMTIAKLSVFVDADGLDKVDGVPLLRIIGGAPERNEMMGRNANGGFDLRIRPMWREWKLNLRLRYDAGQFSASDTLNLLARVGAQVGIGEGRPGSRMSAGMGLGLFRIATEADG